MEFFGEIRGIGSRSIKLGEFGVVHRAERSGQLHGLMRVREFTQDDAHIFCESRALGREIGEVLSIMNEMYGTFGLNYSLELSTRPSDSIGSDEVWEAAEGALKDVLERTSGGYRLNPGDGAFYGPKIDVHVKDSLGRSWQCGTIQVDFNLPERFGLEEMVKKHGWKDIVMVHRVIYGSMERFMGIMIEHFKGRFPLWLSPLQVCFIGVHGSVGEGCRQFVSEAFSKFRIGTDFRNETVSKRIRAAAAQRVPYIIVLGAEEEGAFSAEGHSPLRVRVRGQNELTIDSRDFLSALDSKVRSRSLDLTLNP